VRVERLFDEVHRIATHYHWSERDILTLSWRRRGRYLARIDRDWTEAFTSELGDG
jgi:hypothetical protein